MTPKEYAKELYWKFYRFTDSEFNELHHKYTRDCALIAVDEILKINAINDIFVYKHYKNDYQSLYKYYQEVKQEIELL